MLQIENSSRDGDEYPCIVTEIVFSIHVTLLEPNPMSEWYLNKAALSSRLYFDPKKQTKYLAFTIYLGQT